MNLELHNELLRIAKESRRMKEGFGGQTQLEELISHIQDLIEMEVQNTTGLQSPFHKSA